MRTSLAVALAGLVALAAVHAVRADNPKQARAVIDKAIKASGGAEKLAKYQGVTFKQKGTYYGMGDGLPYTANYTVQWPDKIRTEIESVFTTALNGDKGWIEMNGESKEMSKEQLAEEKEEQYARWVATLRPLTEKGFTLTPLGESK